MKSTTASVLALAASVEAVYQGFNYDNKMPGGGDLRQEGDWETEFTRAQSLAGTNGAFASARLFTMRQGDSSNPISAIPAAISTGTSLLLGLWCSGGETTFQMELDALTSAISTYGDELAPLVAGISVGSEDLYRDTELEASIEDLPGAHLDEMIDYVARVRSAIAGTPLAGAPIGHVDTWTVWDNSSNADFTSTLDWVGMDTYPYWQKNSGNNSIENALNLFDEALAKTEAGAGVDGKPVWITETGWPIQGETYGLAEANVEDAATYWNEVGCKYFGNYNFYWFLLYDAASDGGRSWSITDSAYEPLWDLSCDVEEETSSSATTLATSTTSATGDAKGEDGSSDLIPTTKPTETTFHTIATSAIACSAYGDQDCDIPSSSSSSSSSRSHESSMLIETATKTEILTAETTETSTATGGSGSPTTVGGGYTNGTATTGSGSGATGGAGGNYGSTTTGAGSGGAEPTNAVVNNGLNVAPQSIIAGVVAIIGAIVAL